jgi:hypothetical protein
MGSRIFDDDSDMATITQLHFPDRRPTAAVLFPGDFLSRLFVPLLKFIGGRDDRVYQACLRVLIGTNTDE